MKIKYSPQAVEVYTGIYSVSTSTKDDRCFVTTNGNMWFCSHKGCKVARSVQHNSPHLKKFSCGHIDEIKNFGEVPPPVTILEPDLDNFVCSKSLRNTIQGVLNAADPKQQFVVQVSDARFCVFGPVSASNPLSYCHVHKIVSNMNHYICNGKDCWGFAAKGKQSKAK